MLLRGSAVLLTVVAACATAGDRQAAINGNSQPDAGHNPPGTDAAPQQPDGSLPIDAAVTTPDAPSNPCAYSGVLASWSLTGQTGSEASTAATSSNGGVTAGSLSRASALTAATGSGSINASNWPTTAQLDMTKYFSVSLTPPSGCTMSVTSIALDMKASSTGPASAAVATSADSFAQTTSASPNATSTPTLTVTGASGAIEIRIFGYGASGTSGTMRVQNTLSVSGTVQ